MKSLDNEPKSLFIYFSLVPFFDLLPFCNRHHTCALPPPPPIPTLFSFLAGLASNWRYFTLDCLFTLLFLPISAEIADRRSISLRVFIFFFLLSLVKAILLKYWIVFHNHFIVLATYCQHLTLSLLTCFLRAAPHTSVYVTEQKL